VASSPAVRAAWPMPSARTTPIVVITRRGSLAQLVASYRPQKAIIYACTNMSTTRRKLWLLRSVVPFRIEFSNDPEKPSRPRSRSCASVTACSPATRFVVVSDVLTGGDSVSSVQVRVFH